MSLAEQTLVVSLAAGIETKADPNVVPSDRLLNLENGVFGKHGTVSTRPGYDEMGHRTTAGDAITDAAHLATRDDELVLFADRNAYSYNPNEDRWSDKGSCACPSITGGIRAQVDAAQTHCDRAQASGLILYAWEDSRGPGVHFSVTDAETGAVYINDQNFGDETTHPRCVAINGFLWLLAYVQDETLIGVRIVPGRVLESAATVPGSPITITTSIRADAFYDVKPYGNRALLVFASTSDTIKAGFLTDAGELPSTVTISVDPDLALACAVSPDGKVFIGYINTTTGLNGYVRSNTLSALSGPTLLDSAAGVVGDTPGARNLTIAVRPPEDDGVYTADFYYEMESAITEATNYVKHATLGTDATVGAGARLIRRSTLLSHAWPDGVGTYVWIGQDSPLQATAFAIGHDGLLVAKHLPGVSGGAHDIDSWLASTWAVDDRAVAWAAGFKRRLDAADASVYTADGLFDTVLDFAATRVSTQVGRALYLSGGMLQEYDGHSVVEVGFHMFPEMTDADLTSSTEGGALVTGKTYRYRAYYEWYNAVGERERSTAITVSHVVGGGDDTMVLTLPCLAHTAKKSPRSDVSIVVYRSEEDPTIDSPLYRVSDPDPTTSGDDNGYVINLPGSNTIEFTDTMSDADLISRELDYQNTGELDNVSPLAPSLLARGKERLWLAGFTADNLVLYSKLYFSGDIVQFHDALTLEIDSEGGPITAMAALNDWVVVFKRNRVFGIAGDGPNNLGVGAFAPPALITSDAGCIDPRSVVMMPQGLMFQSAKGIYLIDQSLQLQYIGSPVEAFNAQVITGATLLADTNEVRFLTEDGRTLVYDYLFGKWSTFTNVEGVAATLWRSKFTFARDNGHVRREGATYTDAGAFYTQKLDTAWLRVAGIQGYQRVWRVLVLGRWKSHHRIRVSVGYDYKPGFIDTIIWDPADVLSLSNYGEGNYGAGPYGGGEETVYQFGFGPSRQKCEAIRFRFEAMRQADPGAAFELTEVRLSVGIKPGPFRLRAEKMA